MKTNLQLVENTFKLVEMHPQLTNLLHESRYNYNVPLMLSRYWFNAWVENLPFSKFQFSHYAEDLLCVRVTLPIVVRV